MAMGFLFLWRTCNRVVHHFRKFLHFVIVDEKKFKIQTFFSFLQTFICYSDPNSHPFISKGEREFLETEIGQLKRNEDLPPTPWIAILTSVPMIALVFAQVSHRSLNPSVNILNHFSLKKF